MTKWCVFSSSTDIRHNLYKLFKQIKLYMHNYPIIINYSFSVAHLSIPFKVLFTEICIRRTVKKKLFHLPYSKSTWDRFIYVDLNHTVKHSTGSYASTPSYPQPSSGRRFNIDVIAHRTNLRFIYNLLQHVSGPVLSLAVVLLSHRLLDGAFLISRRCEKCQHVDCCSALISLLSQALRHRMRRCWVVYICISFIILFCIKGALLYRHRHDYPRWAWFYTSGGVHLDVCRLDWCTRLCGPLGRLNMWSSRHPSSWKLPLVMSLRHKDNFLTHGHLETACNG